MGPDSSLQMQAQPKPHRRLKRVLLSLLILLAVIAAGFAWYVNDYYHADATALAAASDENGTADGVTVRELAGGDLAFVPNHPVAGLIFYPGGKVQPEAYAPLMERCAQQGVLCVLVKPLFNLAILDMNAADGIAAQFPGIETWAIAGHSLGGVAAAEYVAKHAGDFHVVAFLASYPSTDLSTFTGSALSVVGSNDHVLDRAKYENARVNLPTQSRELVIEGGNHARFGNYGEQAGDGTATISPEQQQEQTAAALVELAKAA